IIFYNKRRYLSTQKEPKQDNAHLHKTQFLSFICATFQLDRNRFADSFAAKKSFRFLIFEERRYSHGTLLF
ncbi:hypothetical protein DWV74_11915, partial [Megamonas funiformis]